MAGSLPLRCNRLAKASPFFVFLALTCPTTVLSQAQPASEPVVEDSTELETARTLFYEAVELLDHDRWEEAERRLRSVLEIRYSPVVAYNLANALAQQSRCVEAHAWLTGVLEHPEADTEVTEVARALIDLCNQRLGWLSIELIGDTTDVELIVNGRQVQLAELEQLVPVDPGEAKVVAMRDGREVGSASTVVGSQRTPSDPSGSKLTLQIAPVEPSAPSRTPVNLAVRRSSVASSVSQAAVAEPRDPKRNEDAGLLGQWWFWGTVGVVVAATVTGVVLTSGHDSAPDTSVAHGNFDPPLLEGSVRANGL
ncbi:MAG: hypothetical protein OXU20_41975 [Myxococcales bacterium]|nr:hypothetical protein [Myxococcales bacterium]